MPLGQLHHRQLLSNNLQVQHTRENGKKGGRWALPWAANGRESGTWRAVFDGSKLTHSQAAEEAERRYPD